MGISKRGSVVVGLALVGVLGGSASGYWAADPARAAKRAGQKAWHGKISEVVTSSATPTLRVGDELGGGGKLVTDAKTRARLTMDDGTELVVERDTELEVENDVRTMRVLRGTVLADVAHLEGAPSAHLLTAAGRRSRDRDEAPRHGNARPHQRGGASWRRGGHQRERRWKNGGSRG